MATIDAILQRVRDRGLSLSGDDVRQIELDLTQLPADLASEAEPWIWEAVGLIVNDPLYEGDAKLPVYA